MLRASGLDLYHFKHRLKDLKYFQNVVAETEKLRK